MDNSVVQGVKRTLSKLEAVLNSAWNTTLDFLGATEKSSLWWKAIFERKILKGEVGITVRWFRSKKMDVLWELESLVGSLSREHQGSAEKLKEIVQGSRHTTSFTGTERENNLNNYWFTEQDSNVKLHRRKTQENLNTYHKGQDESKDRCSESTETIPHYFQESDQKPSDLNQSSVSFIGDDLGVPQTAMDFVNELSLHNESAAQESQPMCSRISPVHYFGFCRSSSCPDLTFNRGSLFWNERLCSLIKCSSLPSIYTPEDDDGFGDSPNSEEISNLPQLDNHGQCFHQSQKTSNSCYGTNMKMYSKGIDTENTQIHGEDWSSYTYMNLDKLLLHQHILNILWEDNLSPEMEMQNTNNLCSAYKKTQTVVNENRNRMYADFPDEHNSETKICDSFFNIPPEGQYDCMINCASLEATSRKRKRIQLTKVKENGHKNTTTADRRGISECEDLECCENELSCQINWNALSVVDDSDEGTPVDRETLEEHQSCISETKSVTTDRCSVKMPALPIGVDFMAAVSAVQSYTKPVSNNLSHTCGVVKDYMVRALRTTRNKQDRMRKPVSKYIAKKKKNIIRTLTIDDTPVFITRPVRKTKQNTDLTRESHLEETEVRDLLQTMKFDVSIQPQEEPVHPVVAIKRYLGLEKVELPMKPSSSSLDVPSEVHFQTSVKRNLIQRFVELLRSTWNGSENQRHDEQIKQTTLSDTRLKSEHAFTKSWTPETKHYLTGPSAYTYYKLLALTEAKYKIAKMQAERHYFMNIYKWKQDTLMEIVRIARDYYSEPTEMNLARWKSLKKNLSREHQSYTDVMMQVSKIPDYIPYFTIALTTVQVLMLSFMCSRHGFHKSGVATINQVKRGIPTFLGIETFRQLEEPNPWVGPPIYSFIDSGAVIASCMGPLAQLRTSTFRKGYQLMSSINRNYFGCCEMQQLFNRAGTTTLLECEEMTSGLGKWKMGILCSSRPSTKNSIAHVIKPCCTGYQGECIMVSHEHCTFIKGIFHVNCDHCVQVNCLKELCKLSSSSDNKFMLLDENAPWLPSQNTKWQWWRFLTAIPLVYGIVHLLVLIPVQITMMIPLEMSVGWYRVLLVYVSSSVAGEMVGSYFEPFVPHVGSTSGAGGIIGVAVLELFQAWQFLRCPKWEAIKLLILILFISFLGTFYLISIASFLTGLVVGMLMCLIIIPYITYGRRLGHFRTRLVLIGLGLIAIALITIQGISQAIKNCQICSLLECVPYTTSMCKSYYRNI